jgi:putative tryptophan/tyrosine transport system substrate-binding protein
MRRRDFIKGIAGSSLAWPLSARAQQPALPVIGYVSGGTSQGTAAFAAAVRDGISSAGLIEGKDYTSEFRWAGNNSDRLPGLVSDLVKDRVAVIVSLDTVPAARAAKAATTDIPIVFALGTDPVKGGLVASLNHPGGNITGISTMNLDIAPKLIGLLYELLPRARRIAVLVDIENADAARSMITGAQDGALTLGLQTEILFATREAEIDASLAGLGARAQALIVHPDVLFTQNSEKLATLAISEKLPTISSLPNFAKAGGLMGYGSSFMDVHRQAGVYVARILKGEKPGDLPVQLGTKFTFTINLKTANAIGVDFPPTMLARADEVIE